MTSSRDQRQYQLMHDALAVYRANRVSLAHLIAGLWALLEVLDTVSADWRDSFLNEWGTLEVAYAVALDRGEDPESAQLKATLDEAVRNLDALVQRVLTDSAS